MKKNLLQSWQAYQIRAHTNQVRIPQDSSFLHALWLVLASSDYATHQFCLQPDLPINIAQEKHQQYTADFFKQEWLSFVDDIHDESSLMKALRQFRHKAITRIIWRELNHLCTFEEHLQELSDFADVCVQVTTDFLYDKACEQWGIPVNDKGESQPFVVIAVGKLGAQELNLSSDIDLIFAYPEEGTTSGPQRNITNQQFFTKIGQQLIKTLANITDDGFVFRVDMRLRPHGHSGNLVLTFNAIENYYQYQGRDWERYALIKARVITGTAPIAQKLLALLHPFVYRRYLDYGAFESLREMRDLVAAEVKRKPIKRNIKQGPGGIRQIEFLAQAFQLIRGGQHPQFQHPKLLIILKRINESGLLDDATCRDLEKAYIFLRQSEHRLQLMQDQQTHELPKTPLDRARLYFTMGFLSWAEYRVVLKRHTHHVETYFNTISSTPAAEKEVNIPKNEFDFIWSSLHEPDNLSMLESVGYQNPREIQQMLLNFKESRTCQNLKKHASKRLDKIMPVLILMIAKEDNPVLVMTRMLRLMQSIARRSAYLSLLLEKPKALAYLIKVAKTSEWILGQLCSYPVLLDELLSPPSLEEITDKKHLEEALNQRIGWLSLNDLEGQMDHLRQFKSACYLHVALLEMDKNQNNINVPLVLNNIAEIILHKVYDLSLDFMINHYQLQETQETLKAKIPFGIIAYGKLGAQELSYQSDLDLVFLYQTFDKKGLKSASKTMAYEEYSLRLAQRIIHMLSTHTSAGTLYDVDVRLRPGGSAGLLVSHFDAFNKYLHTQAWTWEHQALVKARLVIAPSTLYSEFEALRGAILTQVRNPLLLTKDIDLMREKMHEGHRYNKNEIKMVKGGLADIDFIAQYFLLLYANTTPSLINLRSSLEIVEELRAKERIPKENAILLIAALTCYQKHIRRKIFDRELSLDEDNEVKNYVQQVSQLWFDIFNSV